MQINNNSVSNANRLLGIVAAGSAKTAEKLATAMRINRASDDAAGLAISEKLGAQIRGLDMASRNASDSISAVRTAEGALGETHDILQRMRELSVQSGNGIYTDSDRGAMQAEFKQLQAEIDRIGNTAEFNTKKLLDGSADFTAQVGANSGQTMNVPTGNDMRSAALGVNAPVSALYDSSGALVREARAGIDISTQAGAASALDALDSAIQKVSSQRGSLGATENRLEHTVNNLNVASENQLAAQSRIKDADMAKEIINQTRNSILLQTTLAMTAQANMSRQSVMQLMG